MSKIPVEIVKSGNVPSNAVYLSKGGGENNLDIGCGGQKINGFVGIDIRNLPGVDIVYDLNLTPWPIQDESVDLIVASHVIEHVDCVITFISEIYRILRKNAMLVIRYPHYSQRHTFRDPTHKRFMTLESLDYFIIGSELFGEYSEFGFEVISKKLNVDNTGGYLLGKISFEAYEKYWCRIFPAWQVIVELRKP